MQASLLYRNTMREDTAFRLEESKKAAEDLVLRNIRCPSCGFHLLNVYGKGHYLLQIKCQKCKFSDVIDTALFRTVRGIAKRKRAWMRDGEDIYMYSS